jgi:hypothetical protein
LSYFTSSGGPFDAIALSHAAFRDSAEVADSG